MNKPGHTAAADRWPKLAYVVKYFPPMPRISGILRYVADLADELAGLCDLRVITYLYERSAPHRESRNGFEVVRLGRPFPFRAGRECRAWKPDAVIFGSGFWRPELLWGYWELFRLGLGNSGARLLLTQYTHMAGRRDFFLKLLVPPPDAVIAAGAGIRRQWEAAFPGRVRLIPPGLKLPPPARKDPPQREKIKIGYFGHLQPHKGPDTLLKIFSEIDPAGAELLIAGEGEMAENLKQRAGGRRDIRITGYLADVDREISDCDLVALPYRSAVSVLGYSRVALEALAAGVPVLTTANPAVAPLIVDGENGLVCSGEEEIKSRLAAFLSDPGLRKKLSAGARKRAAALDIRATARDHLRLIRPDTEGAA